MNTMLFTNDRDRVWLAVVLAPVMLLVGFIALAEFQWSRKDAEIDRKLQGIFPAAFLDAPYSDAAGEALKTMFDLKPNNTQETLSETNLAKINRIEFALASFRNEVDHLNSLENDAVSLSVEFDPTPFYDDIYRRAKTLLENVSAADAIYIAAAPSFFEHWFEHEVRQGRFADAIDVISYLQGPSTPVVSVAKAMSIPGWTLEQIETIERLVNHPAATQNESIPPELRRIETVARLLPWFQGKTTLLYRNRYYQSSPFPIAPSVRLAVLNRELAAAEINNVGSVNSIKKIRKLDLACREAIDSGIDTALQIPLYKSVNLYESAFTGEDDFVLQARQLSDERLAQTAIAIRKFELMKGEFPARLEELSTIGFNFYRDQELASYNLFYQKFPSDQRREWIGDDSVGFDTELSPELANRKGWWGMLGGGHDTTVYFCPSGAAEEPPSDQATEE
ncbi:hypothetical protein [Rhodopirellula sp. MGV]|uniref:hypothetical protein n=1 Tax=Rhodopirellula sp. MGV TaxID=2023130 RepID=UPI000B97B3A8|nr:hypothetical protein [Rhodopirellula sp. MGV]OYP35010.1 hypothetical protein CGZ80_13455 [Rhodopirellula sp. MGV]PNY38091.1 hypothetical protein C2E31_03480 [Rhodopirellula baltica]